MTLTAREYDYARATEDSLYAACIENSDLRNIIESESDAMTLVTEVLDYIYPAELTEHSGETPVVAELLVSALDQVNWDSLQTRLQTVPS